MIPVYVLAALLTLAAVIYAHYEIPRFTRGIVKREVAHAALIVTGVLFGATSAFASATPVPHWIAFALGFGIVHVPAAVILLIKTWRGSKPS
jgi:hypothetical protein